jgi:hypothetical protein
MRNHYSVVIQRNWVTAHIGDIQGAVTFLEQMESIEENYPNTKANNNAPNQTDSHQYRSSQQQNFSTKTRETTIDIQAYPCQAYANIPRTA